MAFVLVLLLTISTMVQVESRSADINKSNEESKQAALLSLQMAIGKLQETAGLDQRVTAPALSVAGLNADDVVGAKNLTGVWRSWEGLDHDKTSGLPEAPDYDLKLKVGETDIDSSNEERFLTWLVSSYDPDDYKYGSTISSGNLPSLTEGTDTVKLLSTGTLGDDADEDDEVHVVPTELADGNSAIAWWIQGENTKALMQEAPDEPTDEWEWAARLASAGRADTSLFQSLDESALSKLFSRQSLDVAYSGTSSSSQAFSGEYFHDVTTFSRGLLTNTAIGGWRKDLSLMSENFDDLADSGLPFFTLSPGNYTSASKYGAVGTEIDTLALIYPFGIQLGLIGVDTAAPNASSMSWASLVNYMTLYKELDSSSAIEKPVFPLKQVQTKATGNTSRTDEVTNALLPVRLYWIFSYRSVKGSDDSYTPYLAYQPVVTMWNPYNVAVKVTTDYTIGSFADRSPFQFSFQVGDAEYNNINAADVFGNGKNSYSVSIKTSNSTNQIWKPGEARIYSSNADVYNSGSKSINVQPGYRTNGGFLYEITSNTGAGSDPFIAEVTYDNETKSSSSVDYILSVISFGKETVFDTGYWMNSAMDVIESANPIPEIVNDDETLSSVSGDGNEEPFLVAIYGLRNTETYGVPTVGYYQNKLITGGKEKDMDYSQSSYDWQFFAPNSWDSDVLPSSDPDLAEGDDESGYLGTSFRDDVGLARLSVGEIPVRPLTSLGQLQNFDLAYNNFTSPSIAHPLGNSRASSFIAANEINGAYLEDTSYEEVSLDHSYVANHLFFDDWFVSSIAPKLSSWSTVEDETLEEVYTKHISEEESLPNAFYLPSSDAVSGVSDFNIGDTDSWREVAAELEVEGMFNINSTSVTAWTAILSTLRDAEVPQLEVGQSDWSLTSETSDGVKVSRMLFSSDVENSGSAGSEVLADHIVLTDAQIAALANEIVEQIHERGPFLSLSEFVNRRLTSNSSEVDLAMGGAIEAALNTLAGSGSEDPNWKITNPSSGYADEITGIPTDESVHKFKEAALGYIAYGYPGWITQADILRPIAPILSARDDTFTIRAYGDVRDPITNEILSQSWCEAVVKRQADYIDNTDYKYVDPSESTLNSELNKRFGRRFEVIHFRWLDSTDV